MDTDIPENYFPVGLSVSARVVLCNIASGDLQRTLYEQEPDWQEVFEGLCRHGLLGLAYRYLKEGAGREQAPTWFVERVDVAFRYRAIGMAIKHRKINQTLAMLKDAGIDFLVFKGPGVAYSIYPHPSLRIFGDLDVIIQERDWARVHNLLVEAGFEPKEALPEPAPKIISSAVRLEQWYKSANLLVEVHYDDILNAGLASRDVEGFWRRAITVEAAGVSFRTLSYEDHLIYLCQHVHYHGYFRLIWLADLAFLVRDHAHQLSWPQILETVRTEEAHIALYYSLLYLERFLGVSAPAGILEAVKPDRFRLWMHERYFPSDTVLSEHPIWPPSFSFYHTPFFRRLLPDLLVMGRRKDKFYYLFRLLTPPRAWLIYYYALRDTPLVYIHYILHPMKLVCHILEEVYASLSRSVRRLARQVSSRPAS